MKSQDSPSYRQDFNKTRFLEVIAVFLKLGFTAFGGPAVHISMMHEEVVRRRKWLTDEQFLDLMGATNLIPGPNSTELSIHLGFSRAGWPGLIAGGLSFTIPAMLIVMLIAWAYQRYGNLPEVTWLLYGIKPVIIAVILQALVGLGKKVIHETGALIYGMVLLILYLAGLNELLLLLGGGILYMLFVNRERFLKMTKWVPALLPLSALGMPTPDLQTYSLVKLVLTFLKIGSVLYGSGYVLFAFLRADLVERFGWLTDQQLVDALAVGQFTPGPLFTTATFIGFQLGGLPAAILATVAIFLPAYIFVAVTNPWIPRLRSSLWLGSLLDGVNITSLALMAGVTIQLALAALVDPVTILLAVASFALVFRFKINSTWLILGGAAAGLVAGWLK